MAELMPETDNLPLFQTLSIQRLVSKIQPSFQTNLTQGLVSSVAQASWQNLAFVANYSSQRFNFVGGASPRTADVFFSEGEKRRPEICLLFAGYGDAGQLAKFSLGSKLIYCSQRFSIVDGAGQQNLAYSAWQAFEREGEGNLGARYKVPLRAPFALLSRPESPSLSNACYVGLIQSSSQTVSLISAI